MDAISFVLGVRTNQLRGNQLRELLYSNSDGNTDEDKPRRGCVKLVYVSETGENVSFGRHIQPSSSEPDATFQSVYKINDRQAYAKSDQSKKQNFKIDLDKSCHPSQDGDLGGI